MTRKQPRSTGRRTGLRMVRSPRNTLNMYLPRNHAATNTARKVTTNPTIWLPRSETLGQEEGDQQVDGGGERDQPADDVSAQHLRASSARRRRRSPSAPARRR